MQIKDVLKLIEDEDVAYVDVRFTDPKGKLQHVTLDRDLVDEDFFEEGFMFDGSSIAGWKSCLLYTSPSPRDKRQSRMPSSA